MIERFDTIVVGAGVSGVAAAVASARHGAKTVLVEAGVCAGGMGSAGLVPCFTPFSYKSRPIVGGLLKELHDRLCENGGSDNSSWSLIDAEWMKMTCDAILVEAGVDVRYLTTLIGVKAENGRICEIEVLDRNGRYSLAADNFIDCTGDAALANAAGVAVLSGDKAGRTQAGSCCFVIAGVDVGKMLPEDLSEKSIPGMAYLTNTLRRYLPKWLANGDLENTEDFEFHVAGGSLDFKHGVARINFGHFYGLGCCDAAKISRMLIEGRRRVREFVECLRKNMPGMENIILLATPGLPDIRESRRIVGRTTLTGDAFWNGETHDDDIAIYDYCVDVHAMSLEESSAGYTCEGMYERLLQTSIDKYYGIPLGICLTREFDNLAVAGRCVSATQEMLGALRVMPASISTGQAVGTAAAMSKPLAFVDISKLRETLANDGVILEY